MRTCAGRLLLAVCCGLALHAAAQTYPNRPIRFVSAYPPGGTTDILARLLGQKVYEDWKQPVVIENKPGGNGMIGTDFVAKAAPDGYTILMGNSQPLAITVTLFSKQPFDAVKDFQPITLAAVVPLVLVVHPSLPVKTTRELIALMKSRPGELNYASAGSGSPQHLTAEMFKSMARVDMTHIPYKGSGPAIIDLVGGQIPIAFESMIPIIPQIKGGKMRALAVTGAKRSAVLPDVPTVAESGVPNFEASAWYGVLAPAGVPGDIVATLNAEFNKVMKLPDVRQRLAEMGTDYVGGTPQQFGDFIKAEIVKWGKAVKESGARAD